MAKKYAVTKEVFIDFAHHIAGHKGACLNIHGHTWCWQITISTTKLNSMGMVIDFSDIKKAILKPLHELLDHSLVLSKDEFDANSDHIIGLGLGIARKRNKPVGAAFVGNPVRVEYAGGLKVVTFPFVPTCETLASWFLDTSIELLKLKTEQDVKVENVRIYEQMHPTTSCCTVTNFG